MSCSSYQERRRLESLDRAALTALQFRKLGELLAEVVPRNRFYADKLASVNWRRLVDARTSLERTAEPPAERAPPPPEPERLPADLEELRAEFARWPCTHKHELASAGEFAANLTYPPERYVRYHRTSGTRGRALAVLDTASDWRWWIDGWQFVLDAADVSAADRVFLAFSFGPFIGFWSAYEAAAARGALVIPGGGLGSAARLDLMRAAGATALFCTPSYALHLAETAAASGWALPEWGVRKIVVAGEPGGSLPATRAKLRAAWGAEVFDHAGATEVGPWGYAAPAGAGLFVNESEFLAEFLTPGGLEHAKAGEPAELVLTTLGRAGAPVIRYRTGDIARPDFTGLHANRFVLLRGGVLGRADDMLIVRGVNVFPSAIEQIVRGFAEVAEYRATAYKAGALDALRLEVECVGGQNGAALSARVAQEMETRLGLRVEVTAAPPGALPRFEGKGRRFVDARSGS